MQFDLKQMKTMSELKNKMQYENPWIEESYSIQLKQIRIKPFAAFYVKDKF